MSNDQATIDALMARIRAEVARRRGTQPDAETVQSAPASASAAVPEVVEAPAMATLGSVSLPRIVVPRLEVPQQKQYELAELLAPQDADFVEAAFRAILGRVPEPASLAHFLGKLRSGELTKIDVLGRLRYSPEGRERRVPVNGLLGAFALSHARTLPGIGYLVALVAAVVQLPRLNASVQRLESRVLVDQRLQAAQHDTLSSAIESSINATRDAVAPAIESATRPISHVLTELSQRLSTSQAVLEAVRMNMIWRTEHDRLAERLITTEHSVGSLSSVLMELRGLADELAQADVQAAGRAEDLAARLESIANAAGASEQRLAEEISNVAHRATELVSSVSEGQSAWAHRLVALENSRDHSDRGAEQLSSRLGQIEREVARHVAIGPQQLSEIEKAQTQRLDALAASMGQRLETASATALGRIEAVAVVIDRLRAETARQRSAIAAIDRRVKVDVPNHGSVRTSRKRAAVEALPDLDAFYADFENRFRGAREEIKARASAYLPDIEGCGAGLPDAVVLDLGSGRGEWLEVLGEQSRLARGIDLNIEFVTECRGLGLDVQHAEVLQALRTVPDGTVGAITSMHLVEHLAFTDLVQLIDECHRALRPGGVIILETPNPENLAVAAHYFYLDPTHRNPLPPPLLAHLVEVRGFDRIEVRRLTEHRHHVPLQRVPDDLPGAQSMNRMLDQFNAAPDYAVVARKP